MPKTYRTISGDIWDNVAKKQLGSEVYTTLLLEANPEQMKYTILPAGINLVIPDITTPLVETLPPWKR